MARYLQKARTEHPRLHGENVPGGASGHLAPGTSPPARGKPLGVAAQGRNARNIPACTGKTSTGQGSPSQVTEHPRLHGENGLSQLLLAQHHGTSPPARGKLGRVNLPGVMGRNIPACTGKTSRKFRRSQQAAEHPRLHGENEPLLQVRCRHRGTSPPARGKREQHAHGLPHERNIPACTGKTWSTTSLSKHSAEHPRLHGENRSGGPSKRTPCGTSPPARGKPCCPPAGQTH